MLVKYKSFQKLIKYIELLTILTLLVLVFENIYDKKDYEE